LNANALFDNATASLKYAQAGLLVTAQNVSGASTDGFVRRTPESLLSSYSPESARPGQGLDGFGRNYSAFLQRQIFRQAGESAYAKSLSASTQTLDKMLTDPATSIAGAMGSFFNAAGSLANEPSNPAYRESLIGSARQLVGRINTTSDVLQTLREDSARGLEDTLRQAGDVMGQLGRVNAQIKNTPSPDLFDERDRLGVELQRLIGGDSVLEGDGTLSHLIGGVQVVEGANAFRFANGDGSQPLVIRLPLADNIKMITPSQGSQPGKMIEVFQRQAAGSSEAAVSFIERGQAGAYITLLNEELPAWQASLDDLADKLKTQVDASGITVAGKTLLGFSGGSAGASNLQVQSTADDITSTSAAATALEGIRINFNPDVTAFTSRIANTLSGWNLDLKLNQTLERSLSDQKASTSGVNLDEEAANLVRYQQLYAAASKMVQMGSQMFDTLLSMMSGR
jgi:flagellar hook-associated protein 1